jgi:hypothetical protein
VSGGTGGHPTDPVTLDRSVRGTVRIPRRPIIVVVRNTNVVARDVDAPKVDGQGCKSILTVSED